MDAPGEMVVEKNLAEALKSGQVGGAALDVFEKEPLKESQFFGLPTVIMTPPVKSRRTAPSCHGDCVNGKPLVSVTLY